MSPLILAAPAAFKGTLGPRQVAEALAAGVRQALPEASVLQCPLSDGGDGLLDAVLPWGSLRERLKVTGPLGEPVSGELGWLDARSEEHTSELQSLAYLVCRLLLEKKKKKYFVRVQHREECRNQSAVRDDRRLAQRKSRR